MTAPTDATRARIRELLGLLCADHEGLKVDAQSLAQRPPAEILSELRQAAEPVRDEAHRAAEEARRRLSSARTRGRLGIGIFIAALAVSFAGMLVPALDPFGLPAVGVAIVGYLLFRFSYVGQLREKRELKEQDAEAEFWRNTEEDWDRQLEAIREAPESAAEQRLEAALGDAVTRGRRKQR